MSTLLQKLEALLDVAVLEEAHAEVLNKTVLECISENPSNLKEISKLLLSYDKVVDSLDALSILPSVLESRDTNTILFVSIISKRCSAKECTIALQETVEQLHQIIEIEGEDDDDTMDLARLSRAQQLDVILTAYSYAVPRLVLRKKTAHDTLKPLLRQLSTLLDTISKHCTKTEGRLILLRAANLVSVAFEWVQDKSSGDAEATLLLTETLRHAVSSMASYIDASLSTRTFQSIQPRLAALLRPSKDWEIGEEAILKSIDILSKLGSSDPSAPSLTNLVLRAHSPRSDNADIGFIESHLSVVIASIQSNVVLDETLALLCRVTLTKHQLSPESILPLTQVLPSLASAHPNSTFRFIAFRILASLLSSAPPDICLPALRSLFDPDSPPQMRAAAVGLVKEAVLDGLVNATVFGSPIFLQVFAPILFVLPEEFSEYELEKLGEKGELNRLTESLALYFVVFSRDTRNKTGIRDKDNVSRIHKSLLSPLRLVLQQASQRAPMGHESMSLASLGINLERIEDVLKASGYLGS